MDGLPYLAVEVAARGALPCPQSCLTGAFSLRQVREDQSPWCSPLWPQAAAPHLRRDPGGVGG